MDTSNSTLNQSDTDVKNEVGDLKTTISEYFDRIADCFIDDKLTENYSKKDGKMNWVKMRKISRRELAEDLKEEWNGMWDDENLTEKIMNLRNIVQNSQKTSRPAWRPKTGDIGSQCRSLEKMRLTSEKEILERMLKEKQETVTALKSQLTKKWDDFRILQLRVNQHQVFINSVANDINCQYEQLYQNYSTEIPASRIEEKIQTPVEKINA